ncbi:hypothetical protein SERLADRAFT_440339 [Serpula lacrymans var. lacrymans S7.9]|uniref:Uncharacterized protein n=1 Tax=Serpula lacrymans var. lacrymans (strain S7.9) TaxID=578457 RepID=F8P471_SERL9|nr:uncharacterized protein SERLADRAFT_440339 [Serpula lacrymans var. lacrymans S7.9]EGO22319.1 hypothetical protein SERLADRAFT_440339 [Serpula lacrymans var. lacrymans S7.9]
MSIWWNSIVSPPKSKVGEKAHSDISSTKDSLQGSKMISCIGKPDSLTELQTLAQTIDTHYWEQRSKQAFTAQQSGLKYLSGTPNGKVSFGIFGTMIEDKLLDWVDGRGKGIFGIRREDLANRGVHADRARWLYEYSSTQFVPPVPIIP